MSHLSGFFQTSGEILLCYVHFTSTYDDLLWEYFQKYHYYLNVIVRCWNFVSSFTHYRLTRRKSKNLCLQMRFNIHTFVITSEWEIVSNENSFRDDNALFIFEKQRFRREKYEYRRWWRVFRPSSYILIHISRWDLFYYYCECTALTYVFEISILSLAEDVS